MTCCKCWGAEFDFFGQVNDYLANERRIRRLIYDLKLTLQKHPGNVYAITKLSRNIKGLVENQAQWRERFPTQKLELTTGRLPELLKQVTIKVG